MSSDSTPRIDLFGPETGKTIDGPLADERSAGTDLVGGGPAAVTPAAVSGGPLDGELIPGQPAEPFLDGAGDEPGDGVLAGVGSLGDDHGPGVLDAQGVDPIGHVGAGQAGEVLDLGSGNGARPDDQSQGEKDRAHAAGESTDEAVPRWMRRTLWALGALVVAVMAFAIFEPVQVLPRIRLSPGFAMTDQSGEAWTSETSRGGVTLYSFAYGDCGAGCLSIFSTMAEVAARSAQEVDLGGVDLNLVTVSFDPESDAGRLQSLADASGADGSVWRWATLDPGDVRNVVGSGFRVYTESRPDGSFVFDPTFVLVDGWGVIRGEYTYATLASDADKLIRHIGVLGEELRNSSGVASVAYEAAHIFLCYP